METPNSIVPETGERVFRYESRNLTKMGWSDMSFAVVWLIACTGMLFAILSSYSRDPASVQGSVWGFLLGLLAFFAIGIGLFVMGLAYVRTVKNEKIVLTPTELVWIDRTGRERARCLYSQVRHAEETVLSQPSNNRYTQAPMHHRCVLMTDSGRVVFSDEITDYEKLSDFFLSQQTAFQDHGIFRYRNKAIFLVSVFVLPVSGILTYTFVKSYVNGEQMSINGVMQKTPFFAPLMVCFVSAIFWVILGYGFLNYIFERIVVSSGRVKWYGPTGRLKVDCALTLIEHGSFTRQRSKANEGSYGYSVMTPRGKIKWSDAMTGCTDLVRILKKASEESTLGGDARNTGMPS